MWQWQQQWPQIAFDSISGPVQRQMARSCSGNIQSSREEKMVILIPVCVPWFGNSWHSHKHTNTSSQVLENWIGSGWSLHKEYYNLSPKIFPWYVSLLNYTQVFLAATILYCWKYPRTALFYVSAPHLSAPVWYRHRLLIHSIIARSVPTQSHQWWGSKTKQSGKFQILYWGRNNKREACGVFLLPL